MLRLGLIIVLLLSPACGESDFRSEGKKKDEQNPVQPMGDTRDGVPQGAGLHTETHNGAQPEPYKVDIIFLLDTSESMDSKIQRTLSNLQYLLTNFLDRAAQYDYQVFMVGAVTPPSGPKVSHIARHIGSHSALDVAIDVIKGQGQAAGAQVRPDAVKELVVVSDDDANMSATDFLRQISALQQEVHVSGIVTTGSTCGGLFGIGAGDRGDVYIKLAQTPQTYGVLGDICAGNWDPIFANLGKQLTQLKTGARVRVQLRSPVTDPSTLQVALNGQPVPPSNFQFDPSSNSLTISQPTQPTDEIKVSFR